MAAGCAVHCGNECGWPAGMFIAGHGSSVVRPAGNGSVWKGMAALWLSLQEMVVSFLMQGTAVLQHVLVGPAGHGSSL